MPNAVAPGQQQLPTTVEKMLTATAARGGDGIYSRRARSTPVSIGRVNSPRAVSGLLAR
jgi:hypothetical protein